MKHVKIKLHPVKASEYVQFDESYKNALLEGGGVPVNDIFIKDWNNQHGISLLYGGYGSGKSVYKATELINKCLNTDYFKCFYGRKVKDKVRESVFATIRETIEDFKLDKYFNYSKTTTGTMVIQSKTNGGLFIPFGSDNPEDMKSIKDPTDIWCEELDQFTKRDFEQLYPRLRTERSYTQFHGTFNTGPVYKDHWIWEMLFAEDDPFIKMGIDVRSKIHKTFANYTDNYFIDQNAYYERLVVASGGNQHLLNASAKGFWGVKENNDPWLYAFNKDKHVKRNIAMMPTFPIHLSFDFNREPATCLAMQMSPQKGSKHSFVHFIKEFVADVQLADLCQMIKAYFPAQVITVTGDAAGNRGDIGFEGRNQTYYTMIKSYLKLSDRQMQVNSSNLYHNDSRNLCNTMLYSYPNMYISESGCPNLIRECEIARVDIRSSTPGKLLKDRQEYKMDIFDAFRYHLQTHFLDFVEKFFIKKV